MTSFFSGGQPARFFISTGAISMSHDNVYLMANAGRRIEARSELHLARLRHRPSVAEASDAILAAALFKSLIGDVFAAGVLPVNRHELVAEREKMQARLGQDVGGSDGHVIGADNPKIIAECNKAG